MKNALLASYSRMVGKPELARNALRESAQAVAGGLLSIRNANPGRRAYSPERSDCLRLPECPITESRSARLMLEGSPDGRP
jgi:hypothetical protein